MAPNSIGAFLFNNQEKIETLTRDFKSLLNRVTQCGKLQKQRKNTAWRKKMSGTSYRLAMSRESFK